jgi:hydroxyacylglutathione hydrolase
MNNLIIRQLELGEMANYNYVLGDKSTGAAAVVDPGDDTDILIAEITKEGLKLCAVLLTHGHFDHVGGAAELTAKFDVPAYLSKKESLFYTPRCKNLKRTQDNEKIALGSLSVECLHTPGHTPGGQCFLVEGNLFTGDTLFIDAVGRTDIPGGNTRALIKSLQRIKELPDDTMIWPGHHYGEPPHEKLGILKRTNPYLARGAEADLF